MAPRFAIALDLARRFVRWWLAELAFLVPPQLRKRLGTTDRLALAFTADAAMLSLHTAGVARALGEVPTGAAHGSARVHELLDRVPGLRQRVTSGRVPVTLRLASDQALRTRVTLPLAAEANLRQALVFQLDRRTPFPPDTIHFAHRVVARDEVARQLDLELAVVPRSVVADAVAAGQALGLRASAVEVAGSTSDDAPSGNLLPESDRPRRRPATVMRRVAIAAFVVAALAVIYRPLYVAQRTAHDLQRRMQAARELALRGQKLKDEVTKLTEAERFLIGGKRETASATEVLYELTHMLPDDTWLQDLHVGDGEIRISGYSKSASTVIKLLEQSGAFVGPQFRSAVTQDQATAKERFEIAAKIAKRPLS